MYFRQQDELFEMTEKQPISLESELDNMIADCTECGSCVSQCAYLQRYGTPSALADSFRSGTLDAETIYSCSLCSLCDVYCPEKLSPSRLFWLMRCEMVEQGRAPLKQHRRILAYEKWGLSKLFQLTAIPENADTVFYPGCALAGTRPAQLLSVFEMLKRHLGDLGMVLSCCGKPSHDLGRTDFFRLHFGILCESLVSNGVKTVITACPSCHQIFQQYGSDIKVQTVYDVLSKQSDLPQLNTALKARIHDPCATRFESEIHESVRKIAGGIGVELEDMKHRGKRTYCCGEGGSASFVDPVLTDKWAEKRGVEAESLPVLTYCAGCVQFLSRRFTTIHILDLMLDPEKALAGDLDIASSPWTYGNRLTLKWKLKRMIKD